MEAVIKLDVPEWQIGQPVTVYFKDTMEKHGTCELDITKELKEEYSVLKAAFVTMPDWLDKKRPEVVRCKDCKYALRQECLQDGFVFCTKPYTADGAHIKSYDWYCADGERKECR